MRVDEPFPFIAQQLVRGRLGVFIGPGGVLAGRPAGASWEAGRYQPSGLELARHLGELAWYPESEDWDLWLTAEFLAARRGRAVLERTMREIYDADYPPTPLDRFLADVPRMIRERADGSGYPLILTMSFADTLERALDDQEERYDLLVYDGDRFLHAAPGEPLRHIDRPNEYMGLSGEDRTVIVKLLGSLDRSHRGDDRFVLTESDLDAYMLRSSASAGLPAELRSALERSFLFLGCTPADWATRVVMRRLLGPHLPERRSFAFMRAGDELDRAGWRPWNVAMYVMGIDEVVEGTAQILREEMYR